jgi:hypothetical protein
MKKGETKMRRKSIQRAILMLALAMMPFTARATSYQWNTTSSGNWATGADWNPTGPPVNSTSNTATINTGTTATPVTGV